MKSNYRVRAFILCLRFCFISLLKYNFFIFPKFVFGQQIFLLNSRKVVKMASSLLPSVRPSFLSSILPGDAGGPVEVDLVQACVGGSAQVPCPPPRDGRGAVEGVVLKRQRGDAAAEVLYDSKRLHGSSSSSSSSQFPSERIRLSSAPGPAGITYNLSLQQLQLHDSGLYSCQLLQRDGPDGSAGLGRSAIFVSVEGGETALRFFQSFNTASLIRTITSPCSPESIKEPTVCKKKVLLLKKIYI